EPARGRKPVLGDELAAVVVKQQYPPERLLFPLDPPQVKQILLAPRFGRGSYRAGFAKPQ
ncbi:MAG: hypothetical protein JXA30_18700, partial [Deltaproteobacteria bacterium]|nr:hypothetical protein [Deltaproteobacteria bacterium]